MTRYTIGCCDRLVAEVDVSDEGHVTVHPPAETVVYRLQAVARIEHPDFDDEQKRIERAARDQIWRLMMRRVAAVNWPVSEIVWGHAVGGPQRPWYRSDGHHSLWVLRCPACAQQLEIRDDRLGRLGRLLRSGDWTLFPDSVIPLYVLHQTVGHMR